VVEASFSARFRSLGHSATLVAYLHLYRQVSLVVEGLFCAAVLVPILRQKETCVSSLFERGIKDSFLVYGPSYARLSARSGLNPARG
jgi:hypothetical protein